MSAEHDRKFFDTFMLVLGILAAMTIGLMILAGIISSNTAVKFQEEDPLSQKETLQRIEPVARVAVAGQGQQCVECRPPLLRRPPRWICRATRCMQQVCAACHAAGIAGAPKLGDKAAWAPRLAQASDTLHKHAIEGYQGKAGFMPPKGGRTDLSDKSVMDAVDHMVAASK